MDRIDAYFSGGLIGAFLMLLIILIVTWDTPGYKEGQIDALTGKIKYELKKQEDGQTIWVDKND